ncbi:hypothetical protein [Halomarina oriensis]|uniref:Uncharacterized protein n=1 Tax=Halomarina oriensis TaxID=671145 RepID=A0A6B0GR89_9EURY|nr:hypothetical protein [Halomarina oriensis]MWG36109.1 hypothetical protein [Halomarina oriensis]
MSDTSQDRRLERVEHILGSGSGVLGFAIDGQNQYETWVGVEDAEWTVYGVKSVENAEEDRFVMYPEEDYFICEITSEKSGGEDKSVQCWSE